MANGDAYTIATGQSLSVSPPGVLGNDADPDGDPIAAIRVSSPANGILHLNTDGSFTYSPDPGFTGTDGFAYEASDGTARSAPGAVTIRVRKASKGPRTSPSPTPSPTVSPSPSGPGPTTGPPPSPGPGGKPKGGSPGSGPKNTNRSPLALALHPASNVPHSLASLTVSLALAVFLFLLMLFPAELFNTTLEEHYDELKGRFAPVAKFLRLRPRTPQRGRLGTVAAVGGFAVVAALVYSVLNPHVGFNAPSLYTFLGLFVGILVVAMSFDLPLLIYVRVKYGETGRVKVLNLALVVAVVCVAVSRITHFLPGYIYGIIGSYTFGRQLSKEDTGKATALSAAWLLVVSFGAWLIWLPVNTMASKPSAGPGVLIIDAVLVAVFVSGLEAVVFGLLPMRFLDGHKLITWRKGVWAGLYGLSLLAFVHILINPNSGYLSNGNVPVFTILALFTGFALFSVAFWAYFRYRRPREVGPAQAIVPAPGSPGDR